MDIDSFNFFSVNVTSNIGPFIHYQNCFTMGDALDVEDGFGASPPCVVPVTADHAADFAVAVDDGVDEEARIDLAAGFDHVVVERVVVNLEGPRLGVDAVTKFVSQSVAVVALDRFETGNAGQDEFAAAAVTGEEMGRNAIDDDDFVGVDNVFVEFQRAKRKTFLPT